MKTVLSISDALTSTKNACIRNIQLQEVWKPVNTIFCPDAFAMTIEFVHGNDAIL